MAGTFLRISPQKHVQTAEKQFFIAQSYIIYPTLPNILYTIYLSVGFFPLFCEAEITFEWRKTANRVFFRVQIFELRIILGWKREINIFVFSARCDGLCSVLRGPTQRAAMALAPHCIILPTIPSLHTPLHSITGRTAPPTSRQPGS